MVFFKSFSLKEERNVKNLAFLVGNTIFPLNNKQIKKRFLVSLNLCVFCFIDCLITLPKPRLSLI